MEEAEREFWIAIGLWGASAITVFGTGLFALVEGFYRSGAPLTVVGVVLIAYTARHLKGKRLRLQHALFGALILTWLFSGYDFYDRHYHHQTTAWDASTPLERVYGASRHFTNETVILDGKHFIEPVFDNVTFFYNGTGPVQIDNPTYTKSGLYRLESSNEIVTTTMSIETGVAIANGCQGLVTNYGPTTPK